MYEKRPANAHERINAILAKMGGRQVDALPPAPAQAAKAGLVSNMVKLLAPEHRAGTLTLWTAFFLCFSTLYFLMSWIPNLMDESGYEPAIGRQAFLYFNLGGAVGIYLMSYLSTRWKLTNMIFLLSLASALLMVVFAYAPRDLDLLLGLILLIGILQQGGFTGLYGVAAKLYPTSIRSTGIGWAIGLGRSGAVVGPAVAGYLIAAGLDMSANFIIFAVPMAVGGLIAFLLHID
ncbi:MAG: MFS transporter [Pseudomonadota bacterium]